LAAERLKRWIECVPNFSNGRDASFLDDLARAVRGVAAVRLLDYSADKDHNRSVYTFAGPPEAVAEAAFAAVRIAVERIDLNDHEGVHPRIGAADVVPFVPLENVAMSECADLAHGFANRLWSQLGFPSFLYEKAGTRRLEEVRRAAKAGAAPDIGIGRHPTAGACAVGARDFLIAWNIWLETADLEIARRIARSVRFSSGGFPGVKALGLPLASEGIVQVSINSTDFRATPLHAIFDAVKALATSAGVAVRGSELIGLIPAAALRLSAGHDLGWLNFSGTRVLDPQTWQTETRETTCRRS
jgi:glutamate formiminotransferase/glutamate formiminotransferase/formiminotetrahydrofolate cyclodeaminase